ncbi:HNH endonuclease family protein [Porticoccus sp.]
MEHSPSHVTVREHKKNDEHCAPCLQFDRDYRYFYKLRTQWPQQLYKEIMGCDECGKYTDDGRAFEFDHIEPRNGNKPYKPRPKGKAFFKWVKDPNIQVLCGDCHNVKSNKEKRVNRYPQRSTS